MENRIITCAVDGALSSGQLVKMTGNLQVAAAGDGDAFCGKVLAVESDGFCSVQMSGFLDVEYSGSMSVGRGSFVADADGKLQAASDEETTVELTVVSVVSASTTATIYLGG